MHSSVLGAWLEYIKKDEGNVAYMYLDRLGLVTVGIGNLIDPVGSALGLPFQYKLNNKAKVPAGRMATREEIDAEWKLIKNHPNREKMKIIGHTLCAGETNLELTQENRLRLFETKTRSNEILITKSFPNWEVWPADAQLAVLAMAWGLGAGFGAKWPKFRAACAKLDFDAAAAEGHVKTWRPSRNKASQRLLSNAARVVNNPDFYERSKLYYPVVLADAVLIS